MTAMTNYFRNKIIDFAMRGQVFVPPTSMFVALCSGIPTASSAGTALSGTGYARQEIDNDMASWAGTQSAGSTSASSGTSGITSNNAIVDFGTAGAAWGTAAYWELWDAVTGGNRLLFGTIVDGAGTPTPRSIGSGDPVSFPISALAITWT